MALIPRLFLGVPFIIRGIMKLRGGEASLIPVLVSLHIPGAKEMLACLVGVCGLVGGLGIVVGFPLQLFKALLGSWCMVTTYVGHCHDMNALLSHTAMIKGFFLTAATA